MIQRHAISSAWPSSGVGEIAAMFPLITQLVPRHSATIYAGLESSCLSLTYHRCGPIIPSLSGPSIHLKHNVDNTCQHLPGSARSLHWRYTRTLCGWPISSRRPQTHVPELQARWRLRETMAQQQGHEEHKMERFDRGHLHLIGHHRCWCHWFLHRLALSSSRCQFHSCRLVVRHFR